MVEVPEQPILGQVPELVEVHYIPRVGVNLPFDSQLQLVIVTVEVGIAALPECLPIPFLRESRIVETMGGIEVHAAGDGAKGHAS